MAGLGAVRPEGLSGGGASPAFAAGGPAGVLRVAVSTGPPVDSLSMQERIAAVNGMLENLDVGLRFKVESETDTVRILVVDGGTGKVIRSIPPEYFMKMAAAPPAGLFLDEDV